MNVDPIACGTFLLAAMTLAGVVQTVWFATPASHALAIPLDAGLRVNGRRLFGANKTIRGFAAMIPASAASFMLLGGLAPHSLGLWDLPPLSFALLGASAGFGFMAGELPNSFVKRQLGIAPGAAARTPFGRAVQFAADRFDSGVGMLAAISAFAPTPWQTWVTVLTFGPAVHWSFSVVMFRLGLKARPA
jgi:hypothetical protein